MGLEGRGVPRGESDLGAPTALASNREHSVTTLGRKVCDLGVTGLRHSEAVQGEQA